MQSLLKQKKQNIKNAFVKSVKKNKYIYIMALPIIIYYIIFHYGPMYGLIIAFKDFNPMKGILKSPWIGLEYFETFFSSIHFWKLLRNTLVISLYSILFEFPFPIIFALLLNEIRRKRLKKSIQTITCIPHFISIVVVSGIIITFTDTNSFINDLIESLGGNRISFLTQVDLFRGIYISTNIWQHFGWNAIIYLAALSSIDPHLYEAAVIDGAGRFKQVLYITLPGIASTISVLLILRVGNMLTVGWEKIILLYNPLTYEKADVISTYVYRRGLLHFDFSYSAAVGFFNSIANFIFLITANLLSKKFNQPSLW